MSKFYYRLRSLFGISFNKRSDISNQKIPTPSVKDTQTGKMKPVKFPDEIQKLYDQWLSNNFDSTETLRNRIERYKDLDYMYYNNTVISMATELYADETVQSDAQSQILQINAKDRKVEKYIIEFFNKIGVTQKILRAAAFDLSLYGDHFWILPSNKAEGIKEIVPIDVYSCTDRLEFNAIDVKKNLRKNQKYYTALISRDTRLLQLMTALGETAESEDVSQYFMSYLFGFQFDEDIFLAPWNVSHFRRFTTKSEFSPFGRPIFINCISPFRQLQASKNLMALARAYKFPKEHFSVQTDEGMTQTEKWEAVNEAREEYQNLSIIETGKDHFAVGGQIWSPDNLLTYDLIENRMSLDDIADIEMLRDDLIMGTRVPKGYLIVDRASFGTSGQALLQQFKPFGRTVFTIQSALLDELVNIVRMQFAMTGDYPYDTDFELTLPFPVIEESADRLRMKSDTLRLATDVISNLQSALGLGRDDVMPPDVVKDILGRISFIDPDDLETWLSKIYDAKEKQKDIDKNNNNDDHSDEDDGQVDTTDSDDNSNIDLKLPRTGKVKGSLGILHDHSYEYEYEKKIREKVKSRLNEDILRETYFRSKKRLNMTEGVSGNRHYVTSANSDKMQKKILEMIVNGEKESTYGSESSSLKRIY